MGNKIFVIIASASVSLVLISAPMAIFAVTVFHMNFCTAGPPSCHKPVLSDYPLSLFINLVPIPFVYLFFQRVVKTHTFVRYAFYAISVPSIILAFYYLVIMLLDTSTVRKLLQILFSEL